MSKRGANGTHSAFFSPGVAFGEKANTQRGNKIETTTPAIGRSHFFDFGSIGVGKSRGDLSVTSLSTSQYFCISIVEKADID
jgi:hypothetical protein